MRTLDFNEKIVYPEGVVKTGYTFNGWDNKPDRMPAENITVTAQWVSIEEPEKPSEKPENPENLRNLQIQQVSLSTLRLCSGRTSQRRR